MQVEIRSASVLDTDGICLAVRRSIAECCTADHKDEPSLVAAWLENKTAVNVAMWVQEPGSISLVATVGDKVVGFTLYRNGELALCYVIPEVLHKGVGKGLLLATEARVAAQGFTTIRVDSTQTGNDFYQRNGYRRTGSAIVWAGMKCQPMFKSLLESPQKF